MKKNYEMGKDLGSGNFAVVKEATKRAANKTAEIPNKVAISKGHRQEAKKGFLFFYPTAAVYVSTSLRNGLACRLG